MEIKLNNNKYNNGNNNNYYNNINNNNNVQCSPRKMSEFRKCKCSTFCKYKYTTLPLAIHLSPLHFIL